ncbi:MAG: GtrA family protein [Desulfobulbaceae bacterium]|nr:GtrA family protein [Desulfobulbaceae bacterium]
MSKKDVTVEMNATKKLVGELSRYTVVGGVAFIVDFFLLYSLTEWASLHYLLSATLSFLVGLFVNYYLSIQWVFRYRSFKSARSEFMIFLFVGLGGLLLNDLILAVLTPVLNGQYMIAKIAAVVFVYLWNFFVRRKLLFSKHKKKVLND